MTPNSPKITDRERSEGERKKKLAVVFCFHIVNFRQFFELQKTTRNTLPCHVPTEKNLVFKNPGGQKKKGSTMHYWTKYAF